MESPRASTKISVNLPGDSGWVPARQPIKWIQPSVFWTSCIKASGNFVRLIKFSFGFSTSFLGQVALTIFCTLFRSLIQGQVLQLCYKLVCKSAIQRLGTLQVPINQITKITKKMFAKVTQFFTIIAVASSALAGPLALRQSSTLCKLLFRLLSVSCIYIF